MPAHGTPCHPLPRSTFRSCAQDAKKGLEDAIQKLTDQYCKKVDDMVKAKSDELMKL